MLYQAPKSEAIIKYVLDNLREEDKREMAIEFGQDWKKIVFSEAIQSQIYGIKDEKEEILGLFGIEEISKNEAQVCLLTTDKLINNGFSFLKNAKRIVAGWNRKYSLCNYVYKENKQALKWLEWLGFTLIKADENRFYFYKGQK